MTPASPQPMMQPSQADLFADLPPSSPEPLTDEEMEEWMRDLPF